MPLMPAPITSAATSWPQCAWRPVRRRSPKKISSDTVEATTAITMDSSTQPMSHRMPGAISMAAIPV